jgi:hypothetical protein
LAFATFLNLTVFRVEIASFVAGVLAATLAFFVVFRELSKLFFCMTGSSSFEFGPGYVVRGAGSVPNSRARNLVLALQMKIGLARTEASIVQERR